MRPRLNKYSMAVEKDPSNQDAVAGKQAMLELTGRSVAGASQLDQVAKDIETRRQAIQYNFDDALTNGDKAIAANNFTEAQAQVNVARVARNQDPQIFSPTEIQTFDSRLADAQLRLDNSRTSFEAAQKQQAAEGAAEAQRDRELIEEQNKRTAVTNLINQAMRLTTDGKFEQALGVIDQILVIDPKNDYARGTRPLVEDRALFQEQRRYREQFDRQLTKQYNASEERRIPYNDILRYPENWPELSDLRDQTNALERGEVSEDTAVSRQLDQKLPEVKFDNVAFSDVVDFFRDVSGANIFVDWRSLEGAGIDKSAQVSERLHDVKFSKALSTVLADVGGGTVKLGYSVDEGVITISTAEVLSQSTVTRVYDIRDLIINIPDFTDAPDFNISSNNTQTSGQGGGGGGGGGGQSLFGGGGGAGGQGGNEPGQPTRQDLVDSITKLIEDTVATESWKDNGGTSGSLRELSGQLVVQQTGENHGKIVKLLEQLRETRAIQVTIETRFLKVQRNFLESVGVDFDFQFNNVSNNINGGGPIQFQQNSANFTQESNIDTTLPGSLATLLPGPAISTGLTYIDDFQASIFISATQANAEASTITAPRVTLFNGQRAFVLVATTQAYVSDLTPIVSSNAVGFNPTISTVQSGVLLDVQATVSADRKYVTLTLRPQLSNLLSLVPFSIGGATVIPTGNNASTQPFNSTGVVQQPEVQITEVRTTVSVPDGGTLLLGGQTISGELEREQGVPVLSKIPFLKRLFTNRAMSKDDQVLLILVKPTIIIQREQEQKQFPLLTTRTNG